MTLFLLPALVGPQLAYCAWCLNIDILNKSSGRTPRMLGAWHEDGLRELGLFSLDKKGSGITTVCYSDPPRRDREDGSRTFSEVCGDRKRGNKYKMEYEKFQVDDRKKCSPWRWLNIGILCPERLWVSILTDVQDSTEPGAEQPNLITPYYLSRGLG